MSKRLELIAQPQDFFRELVSQSLAQNSVKAFPETEFYLVNLLNQFMTTENLYLRDGSGNFKEEPLALMVKEASESGEPERSLLFRKVGDISLYMAGYFQESLSRKVVDVDYYVQVGGGAYKRVAARAEKALRGTYEELSYKFSTFVDILADVSEKTTVARDERDLLRLYETWIQTNSKRAESKLKKAGILPVQQGDPKKSVQ